MENLNYGIIGNCQSAALVSNKGTIVWCCMPDFDSPSIFAHLLDNKKGGCFAIIPEGEYEINQYYAENTNVLVTVFRNSENEFELIDFMPRYKTDGGHYYNAPEIYRYIKIIKGKPRMMFIYDPKLNYAQSKIKVEINDEYIKHLTINKRYDSVYLYTNFDKQKILAKEYIVLETDSYFLLSYNQKLIKIDIYRIKLEYNRTSVYWMNWSNRTKNFAKYQNEIKRSALLLKLLTYDKTGAIIAAPTTSIPETLGESRNWDYRYCWIRDSSMIIKILIQIGHIDSAERFQKFILNLKIGKHEDIQIMYGIRGEKNLSESILRNLSGYENCKPVRIGNSAYIQKQNDIYGILLDTIYLSYNNFSSTLDVSENLWSFVRELMNKVEISWQNRDKGIWEIRDEDKHFVFSKVLSWVAADRGEKIACILQKKYYESRWKRLKEIIKSEILTKGWNSELNSFVQSYDSKDLDAANLLMVDYGFIKPDDPMYISTVYNTKKYLSKNGLMFRYTNKDHLGIPKNSFILCSFWLINSLYRIGELQEAESMFVNLLKFSNHLGLFSEHIDIESKRLLGNFPQGYSHLGLIQSALLINGFQQTKESDIFKFIKP